MHIPLMYPYYARFWQNGLDVHRRKFENVAIAGLLHDVGILKFPEEMRKDFTFRKEMEGGVYNKHVLYSYTC